MTKATTSSFLSASDCPPTDYERAPVYDQMIRFRAASRQVEGWSLKENWAAMFPRLRALRDGIEPK